MPFGSCKTWLLLLCAFSFPSCSKLSVGVYWADTFALSQLDDYFTLYGERRETTRAELKKAFRELRTGEFPVLASILEGIAADVEAGALTAARLEHWSREGMEVVRSAARRFEPLGQKLVAEQAKEGFSRFDEEFNDKQEKAAEKLSSPEKRLGQAKRRIRNVVKETLGELTEAQEEKVEALLKENPLLLEHENRNRLFEKFRASRSDEEKRKAFLGRYFTEWDSLQMPEYLRARDEYQKKSRAVMLEVLATASPAQKKHLVERFRGRAEELRKLAAP